MYTVCNVQRYIQPNKIKSFAKEIRSLCKCATFQNYAFVLYKSPIDLVIARENIEYFCVKAERSLYGDNSHVKVAEAIKRISERALALTPWPASLLCAGRNAETRASIPRRLVTITHKNDVLCQNDGLFRESAQAVLPKYFYAVAVEEQIDDSMAYYSSSSGSLHLTTG